MPPKGASGEKKKQAAKRGPKQTATPKHGGGKVKKVHLKGIGFKNPYEGAKPVECKSCGQSTADPERDSLDAANNPVPLKWHKAGFETSITGIGGSWGGASL